MKSATSCIHVYFITHFVPPHHTPPPITLPPSPPPVQGCVDSLPLLNTEDCHYAGHIMLSLHGLYLDLLCPDITTHKQQQQQQQQQQQHQTQRFSIIRCTNHFRKHYSVYVGPFLCRDPTIHSKFTINCTVERGAGEHLDVIVYRNADSQDPNAASKGKGAGEGERGEEEVEMVLERAVSFKEAINFREKFDKFVELGVGGMKKEINELYRRAFASRGEHCTPKPGIQRLKWQQKFPLSNLFLLLLLLLLFPVGVAPDVLQKMGITHVKVCEISCVKHTSNSKAQNFFR